MRCARLALPVLLCLFASAALADAPVITAATASRSGDSWRFEVTLSHPDSGWDHYADAWRVLAPDGTQLGLRVLAHPHVDEQPFTRALGNVHIPPGITEVRIEARCLTGGWSGRYTTVPLD